MLRPLGDGIGVLDFPCRLLGADFGRRVTVISLPGGGAFIHSTAPFGSGEVAAVRRRGEPVAVAEATALHDTFVDRGREAFAGLPYFAPRPLAEKTVGASVLTAGAVGDLTGGAVVVVALGGMPSVAEHAFFHPASKTLIVADLIFNFPADAPRWTRALLRFGSGVRRSPGMSRVFRAMIKDKAAFAKSIGALLELDFERVIVGHGDEIEGSAKDLVRDELGRAGLLP